ncbi:MAG: hypothetical protein HYY86_01140 [Candidatus Harrisonbacteria bacterium]|nr:hypothetical protein [Candidatus Harrisonbacteria bacterium]
MKKILQNIFIGLLLTGLFFISFNSAEAQTINLRSAFKKAAEKISAFIDFKKKETTPLPLEKTGIKKEALTKIFELTLLEQQDLQNKLRGLKNLGEKQTELKNELLTSLQENENAYRELKKQLEEANTSEEIKRLANDFNNWRNLVYKPKVEKVISFTLVFQQKDTFNIAKTRLRNIKKELPNLDWADDLIAKAEAKIQKAVSLNNQAADLISQELRPGFFKRLIGQNYLPAIKSLTEESDQEIKDAYQIFVELGKAVKEK